MTVATPVRSSNPIERDYYGVETALHFLGRTAKGRYDTIDPAKALKQAREIEVALKAFKATCRQDIIDRKQAAVLAKQAEQERAEREAAIRAARAARGEPASPGYVADGLVAMATAMKSDEAEEVPVRGGVVRFLPFGRRKAA